MTDTTALLPDRAQHSSSTFGDTADERFADAVRERQTARGRRARSGIARLVRRPLVLVAVVWVLVIVVAAIAPVVLAPGDPLDGVPADKLLPPSLSHLLGTDQIGRDLYTRIVHGTGLTVTAAAIAVGVGLIAGSALGLVAGFFGGRTDAVLMRVADVLLSIPGLLLSLAIVTVLGFGTLPVAVAVGVASIASVARIMRAEVLKVRQAPYIEAARISGNRRLRLLARHVLPNASGPVIVLGVLEFGGALLAVSALSFLGYGAQPPLPEWGSLVSGGRDQLGSAWWLTTFPGLVIVFTVLAVNQLSRALDVERAVHG